MKFRALYAFLMSSLLSIALAQGFEINKIEALSRTLRIDVLWNESVGLEHWDDGWVYEVQRGESATGDFEKAHKDYLAVPIFSDYIGKGGKGYFYRVRALQQFGKGKNLRHTEPGPWSKVVSARSRKYEKEQYLTDLQEASFRYFYHHAHPVSGMALEGAPHRHKNQVTTGATAMGLFNLVVGVKREFITRKEAAEHALKVLNFLDQKAEKYHGAFSHWMDGTTGKTIPFGKVDDGADLVETAFLAQSFLMMRETFTGASSTERELREVADKLWRGIEWDFFVSEKEGRKVLLWHWSPKHKFDLSLGIMGFNECQIVYLLAMASPTHPISYDVYESGWLWKKYSNPRTVLGVDTELHWKIGGPLFFTHYSYMGFDPRKISHNGKSYFEHFVGINQIQKNYALSKADKFKGYDKFWGITASMGPDRYNAHAPNHNDNGTIAPTAALSSFPYLPDESFKASVEMYRMGDKLWGPFGFYDAFNMSRYWVAKGYLGIDVGPIAPMIENHRSGLCWSIFMQAPEMKIVLSHKDL